MHKDDVDYKFLDDITRMREMDPAGMLTAIEALPEQARNAISLAHEAEIPNLGSIRNVVVLGMGGSAIGGDLTRALYETESTVPVFVNRDYQIPGFVGPETLVVASSYSGNTEETLTAYEQAKERGAKIVVLSTGGELVRRAQAAGQPIIQIPSGLSPRAAIGYSFYPLIVLFVRLGLISDQSDAFEESIAIMERQRERFSGAVPYSENEAKQLAVRLVNHFPLVYGGGGWKGVVAYRWKCQINENSKAVALSNAFPELNHNETVGWEAPPSLTNIISVINLRDKADAPYMHKRIEVTREIMEGRVAENVDIWAEGSSPLARMMSLIYPGDFVSLYLALLYKIDPTPVAMIDRLKDALASAQ